MLGLGSADRRNRGLLLEWMDRHSADLGRPIPCVAGELALPDNQERATRMSSGYREAYRVFYGLAEQDVLMCRWCGEHISVDVHHIHPAGMGGKRVHDPRKEIDLCREGGCHLNADRGIITPEQLMARRREPARGNSL